MTSANNSNNTIALIENGRLQPFGFDPFQICKEQGLDTILVTSNLSEYLKTAVSKQSVATYVDEVIEADISDSAGVLAALAEAGATSRLGGVFSVTEYSVVVVAEVAEALGLPGLSPAAALNARHKQRTRQLCAAAQVPVPEFFWVRSATEARDAAARLAGACVVKPPSEAGGIGVKLCTTPADAERQYERIAVAATDRRGNPRPPGVLVEEYLPGYQVSVEVVYSGGRHHIVGVTDELFGPHPHFVELGENFPSTLPEDAQRDCGEVAVRALRAIGHDFGVAHVEVRMTSGGPVLIEVNGRLAGAQITRLIYEAHGLHLAREAIRVHAGLPPDLGKRGDRAAAVRYLSSPAEGVLADVRGVPLAKTMPGVTEIALYVAPGEPVRTPESIGDLTGYVIAVGETGGEAVRRAEAAAVELCFDVDPAGIGSAAGPGRAGGRVLRP
ncbi:MAG TPA: ATP-grasp domain-containing protein [Streptosporangiaceae bacterium]|nr:ATP-grasp domain-containing protein [Streptosporangiaceae bacterium]